MKKIIDTISKVNKLNYYIICLMLVSLTVFTPSELCAASYTSTQDGVFSDAATWGGSGPPSLSKGDDINIGHTVTIKEDATIEGGTDITVTTGGVFVVDGTIYMGSGGTSITVDVGGKVKAAKVEYTANGVITSNGTIEVTDNFTVQSSGTATFNGTTTIAGNLYCNDGATVTADGTINVGGNVETSGAGDFDITGGTFSITGNLDCTADGNFTADGIITVGGNWSVSDNGTATVGGTMDVGGNFAVENTGWVNGTGILAWGGNTEINTGNSGSYVECVDGSKYDSNEDTPAWPVPPANPWDLSTCVGGALPVELLSFTADRTDDNLVTYSWVTGSEINNDHFEIEASIDGYVWDLISEIIGMGNTINVTEYTSEEKTNNDYRYARLAQVDFDGTTSYSNIVNITQTYVPKVIVGVFDINGRPVSSTYKGFVIIRYNDDTFTKTINQ